MSAAVTNCGQCHKALGKEDGYFADSCGHYKCRVCSSASARCNQCEQISNSKVGRVTISTNEQTMRRKESKISIQTHIIEEASEGGNVQYHCTACGKTFRSRSQKYYHLQCNRPEDAPLYECDVCNKTFVRHSQLKYHIESHVSPINECPKCQKTFSNPLALKKHQTLHKVTPKQCPHCDKTFLKKMSLDQHIAAHHFQQLQYGCDSCNKKYASKSTLRLHLQSHEKKRFECTFCGKHFQRNSILKLHIKRHYQKDTHRCQICDKVFFESSALCRHRKIHEENIVQYRCKICDKNILRKDNMTRHVNTLHPGGNFNDIVFVIKPEDERIQKAEHNHSDADNTILNADDQVVNATCRKNAEMDIKGQNNVLIIENRILQKPNDTKKANHVLPEDKPVCTEDSTSNQNKCTGINVSLTKAAIVQAQAKPCPVSGDITTSSYQTATFENIHCCTEYNTTPFLNNKCTNVLSRTKSKFDFNTIHSESQKYSNECKSLNFNSSTSCCERNDKAVYNKASVIRSIGNVKNITIPISSRNATGSVVAENVSKDYEYIHKKYSRHYNVDLYRKILGCDDECDTNYCNLTTEKQQDITSDASNIIPVHWRKSFKNIYETSSF